MQTETMLYLALVKLMEEVASNEHHNKNLGVVNSRAYEEAEAAMKQFVLELGPLPDWATAHNIECAPVLYAQLYTRDGRKHGNGMIFHVTSAHFGVITDMGNTMTVNREELGELFEIGDYIMDERAYEKRKRQRDDYMEPLEAD